MKNFSIHIIDLLIKAYKKAWGEWGIPGLAFPFGVSLITKIITTPRPLTLEKILGGNWKLSLSVLILSFLITFIYYFVKVIRDNYYENIKIINKLDKQIRILKDDGDQKLILSPQFFEGKNPVFFTVKNYEKRKIIELRARVGFVIKSILNSNNEILEGGWRFDFEKNESILDITDVRPGDFVSGIIATCSEDFSSIKFGKSQNEYSINSEEVIYSIYIKYDGKIEGETIFRENTIDVDIFVKPSKKIICSASIASTTKIINREFEKKFLEYRVKNYKNTKR